MKTIATLGPSVRLIVFQFHVKNSSVPEGIPKYSDFHKSTASQFEDAGVRVMEPTMDVLSDFISNSGYHLIDAWHATEEENWTRSVVRFVFCHKEHLNPAGLRLEFVTGQEGLLNSFNCLAGKNLWKTMLHINPFFTAGKATDESVLMLDCNSRKQTTKLVRVNGPDIFPKLIDGIIEATEETSILKEVPVTVFQGGREKPQPGETIGQGIGPKILLTDKANRLKLVGNEIVLVPPALVPEPVSAPTV